MILDDLFEAMKPSDIPTAMRTNRLTMRDIEAERPKSPYRYMVGDKQFMDYKAAQEFAQGTGEKVVPITLDEQMQDPNIIRGMENLAQLESQSNNSNPVYIKNETGQVKFQIVEPKDKAWVIRHAKEWADAGKAQDLYKFMGTDRGFEFLLTAWEKEDAVRKKSAKTAPEPEEQDLFEPPQAGGPKSPRMQSEDQHGQKKSSDLEEVETTRKTARTQRMMDRVRARQPQATSDLEALAYELQDAERRDSQEIDKLEKDLDNVEQDVKTELQKRIATLTKRRGEVQKTAASDVKIDSMIDQINKANDAQQREIDNLTKAVAGMSGKAQDLRVSIDKTEKPQPTQPTPLRPIIMKQRPAAPAAPVGPAQSQDKDTGPKTVSRDEPETKIDQPAIDTWPDNVRPLDKFRVLKKAAESTNEGIGAAVGKALGWQSAADPFRDLTAGEKAMHQSSREAQAAQSLKLPAASAVQQQFIKNMAAGEQQKVTKQIQDLAKQIKQARAAGDLSQAQSLQRQFDTLHYRAGLLKTEKGRTSAPATKPVTTPTATSAWKMGDPIVIKGETILSSDNRYNALAQAMARQGVKEAKKKPTPTNSDLWSRAKAAARSKFDVYPSAYANAWAAKWYKAKGGGWRMGKGTKE